MSRTVKALEVDRRLTNCYINALFRMRHTHPEWFEQVFSDMMNLDSIELLEQLERTPVSKMTGKKAPFAEWRTRAHRLYLRESVTQGEPHVRTWQTRNPFLPARS